MMIQQFTKLGKTLGLVGLLSLSGLIEAQNFNWSQAGPIYSAGRSRNMVVDKSDMSNNTLFVGSTTSGVFRSINGGINWEPLDDQGTVRNISYMAQDFDNVIYVGTGEGFLRPGQLAKAQVGTGLYKLNGTSLVAVADASITGTVINRIACHPSNSNIVVLATNLGILISNDKGVSFSAVSIPNTTVNVTVGIDVKFNSAGILYFTIGNAVGTGTLNNIPTRVFRSTDNSLSAFSDITPTSPVLANVNYGRVELGISPSSPDVIYACVAKKFIRGTTDNNNTASLHGLFVSDDGGSNWSLIVQGSSAIDPLSNGGTIATGDYSQVLLVNPTNPGQVFIGGFFCKVWTKTSASYQNPIGIWSDLGNPYALNTPIYLHENIHDIRITGSGSNTKFYFITDAGIYRSSDITSTGQMFPPSFQPFYSGLVTGQFNSVSIENFPITANTPSTSPPGTAITPLSGFIGGTGANGLTYYSGTGSLVTLERSYLSGEVYNAEYSKILPDAAIMTLGSGGVYRTTNAKSANPGLVNINYYTGALSRVAPTAVAFNNTGYNVSGTPFKLWENHGQVSPATDNAIFYNDSTRFQASMIGLSTLTTQTTFTFSAARPNKFALIDSIVIRTATVTVPGAPALNVPFSGTDRKDLSIRLNSSYTVSPTKTVPSFTVTYTSPGTTFTAPYGANPSSNSAHGVTLDAQSLIDNISITYTSPPFANKTQTFSNVPDPASYYRVFATVFYKYKVGDSVEVVDNNISTKTSTYTGVLTNSISWRYGTNPTSYTLSASTASAVSNPTYVLLPSNISSSSPSFVVNNWLPITYSIQNFGTYTINANPVQHTLVATNTVSGTNTFTLEPGTVVQTNSVFVVTPTATTIYTITAGNGTTTADTYSTIGATTFVLEPGNIVQSTPEFTVNVSALTVYTLQGLSSSTLSGNNTSSTKDLPIRNSITVGNSGLVAFPASNATVKIPTTRSARLAMAINITQITGGQNAVVVCKSPLNLNDPLNFVRVSQSGCLTDDATGAPTNSTISIPGKPTLIEWSKKGTELYYATDDNKLYRVSHITDIMDLSSSSYSGKLFTDIFAYNPSGNPTSGTINPVSPYRTTLIGSFTKPISSISITNDDNFMALTFTDPAPTGTAGVVMYNTNSIKTSNSSNIGWTKKDGSSLPSLISYCSLLEMNDNKKMFMGTDNGIYYTADITTANPVWVKANNGQLPNVQIFDIEQQTQNSYNCYNSGQIYVATNGRGIWTNNAFLTTYNVSVAEHMDRVTENNITMYPNPTNGVVTIEFETENNEEISIRVFDLNGRMVKSLPSEKAGSGLMKQTLETGDLTAGIYIVNVLGESKVKRAAKLIVTK